MHVGERIRRAREAAGRSQGWLGQAVNASQTAISAWEGGRREPTREMVAKIAQALGLPIPDLEFDAASAASDEPAYVPIIGRVGADTSNEVVHTDADRAYDMAQIPAGATGKAVALEVVGDSMPRMAPNGSLIFFEDQRTPPTPDMLDYWVIAELEDGRVLFKRLLRGSKPGFYVLESEVGAPIVDVRLRWAAEPIALIPPKAASRIIRRAGERQVA